MAEDKRRLRILVQRARGSLPLLVAASVSGCGQVDRSQTQGPAESNAGSGGTIAAGAGGVAAAGSGGSGVIIVVPPVEPGGGSNECTPADGCNEVEVSVPPEGVPAEPGEICSVNMDVVDSGLAARVTLTVDPSGSHQNTAGVVTVAPELSDRIVGTPRVELVASESSVVAESLTVSEVTGSGPEYSFVVMSSEPLRLSTVEPTRLTFRITLEVDCGDTTQIVHAATDVYFCLGAEELQPAWVSSGDSCCVCDVIAEMAPSPIVPDQQADGLPLSRALRLRIVELARVSNTVILLAENDGGPDMTYEWHASGGKVTRLTPDIVVWTLSQGMPAASIQAAVFDDSAAAVASWAFNLEAA